MASVEEQIKSQIRNIETSTGRSIDAWMTTVAASGREKHGEIVAWLKAEHGMSHGNANRVALTYLQGPSAPAGDDLVEAIYSGPKAALRPFHDRIIGLARSFGEVEQAPKQAYVSLRRAKQFATVGPASGGRIELGLNLKGVDPAGRLEATTGMCTHRVRMADPSELDDEVAGWLRDAYDRAG